MHTALVQRVREGEAIKSLRLERGLTQEELARALNQPQSFVSKIESGERLLHVSDLEPLARTLGCNVSTILNRISGLDSMLDHWQVSESELTDLLKENPSMRGVVLGYIAELKFHQMYADKEGIANVKDDDHDRKRKGDRRLTYKGVELLVEVKSLQTNTVRQNPETGVWFGKTQVDGSDRREICFDDGTTLNTTLLKRGEFDILAVNCFAFGDKWRFAFALNQELAPSTYSGYTEGQRKQLIASLQKLTWPLSPPFTDDFDDVLKRAYQLKTANKVH